MDITEFARMGAKLGAAKMTPHSAWHLSRKAIKH